MATPAEKMVQGLRQARALGMSFEDAWAFGLPIVLRGMRPSYKDEIKDWSVALNYAKPWFRAHYYGDEPPSDCAAWASLLAAFAAEDSEPSAASLDVRLAA